MNAVVVGGGVAGLVAARGLALQGRKVTVLEASDRVGGMVHGVELAGVRVDVGAEAYANRPVVTGLCTELGLQVAEPCGRSRVWWPDRGSVPLARGVLGIPGSIDDEAFAALTEEEVERARQDLVEPVGVLPDDLAGLVAERLGPAALERLVAPLARGVFGLSPERMPVERFAPGLTGDVRAQGSLMRAVATRAGQGAAVAQPIGGMHMLVSALSASLEELGAEIRTGAPVSRIRRHDAGWVASAAGDDIPAARIVIATPARAAADLLAPLGVSFDVPAVSATRSLTLALRHEGMTHDPVGSGSLLGASAPDMVVRSLTHYSAKWPWAKGHGVEFVRVSLPPGYEPALDEVLADVARLSGVALGPEHVVDQHLATWPDMPRVLPAAARSALDEAVAALGGVSLAGAWLAGNGLAAVVQSAKDAVA